MKRRVLSLTLVLAMLLTPAVTAAEEPFKGMISGVSIPELPENFEPWLFKTVARDGVSCVRIPITWEEHMDKEYNISAAWLDKVEICVQWALDAGLTVILATGQEEGLYRLIDNDNYSEAKRQLTFMWEQIAERFAGYPEKLVFEVMDAPHRIIRGGGIWDAGGKLDLRLCAAVNRLNLDALDVIRKGGGHNERVVVLAVPGANIAAVPEFQMPEDPYTVLGVSYTSSDDLGVLQAALNKDIPILIKETDEMIINTAKLLEAMGVPYLVKAEVSDYKQPILPFLPPNISSASDWAADNILVAYRHGIIPAHLQGEYSTSSTRAEFCALAVELIETLNGRPIMARKTFADDGGDVNIRKIGGLGIVSGTGVNQAGEPLFSPGRVIQRQEAAIILAKVADKGLQKPLPEEDVDYLDMHLTYAGQFIRQMRGGNIMSGKLGNLFDPLGPFTREESITTMLKCWLWFHQ